MTWQKTIYGKSLQFTLGFKQLRKQVFQGPGNWIWSLVWNFVKTWVEIFIHSDRAVTLIKVNM